MAGCVCGHGGMHGGGEGVCVVGGMCGRGGVWWGACIAGGCMAGGGGMHGKGGGGYGAWQERRPLQLKVRILVECILVIYEPA